MTVQQPIVYAGSYAARATSTGSPAYAYKNLSTPLTELYYDGRFQVISQGIGERLARPLQDGRERFDLLDLPATATASSPTTTRVTGVSTSGPIVSTGSWHELEVHALINGNSSLVEVWLDGTNVITKTAEALGTTGVGRIYIGDTSTGLTFDSRFDNQIVSTSSDISPRRRRRT